MKEFEDLSEQECSYDYDMALNTLKALIALHYQISVEERDMSSVKFQDLPPEKYRMSNGYLPRPLSLDLSALPAHLEDLVDQLAENAHNIWAAARIHEGWTYGKATVRIYSMSVKFFTKIFRFFFVHTYTWTLWLDKLLDLFFCNIVYRGNCPRFY